MDPFNNKSIKVPFFRPYLNREDKNRVIAALYSNLLTDGPKLKEFESKFAKFVKVKYAVGVSNATSALHLSLQALGIGKGDEVIIPDMTFVATASSVLITGATPVFADVNLEDFNISIKSIQKNITTKTKAILPVHFAGKACDMKSIMRIARINNLHVIEDAAHAIGSKIGEKFIGTFGDVGCFSFYPTKNLTTIEGGMITTNSKKISDYIRIARNHGITRSLAERYSHGKPWDYDVKKAGYNYRLDEIRSALGISQLQRVKKMNLIRKSIFQYYNSKLENIRGIILPEISKLCDNVYHLYIIRVIENEYGISRDQLFKKLIKKGIMSSVHYKPIHMFTAFKKNGRNYDSLSNSKKLYKEFLSLPLYLNISKKEQDTVINCIRSSEC